jgi:protein-S-isoprenylcysteine O-methyltransferase Ste14
MFVFMRAIVYASLFVGVVLVFLPAQLIARSGIRPPDQIGVVQVLGIAAVAAGSALAISCVLVFAFIGRGTPAPFDSPRRLVVRGPYRWVRNPMYVGAALALAGAAVFYGSLALLVFTIGFLVATHLFILFYEEPVLQRLFGAEYEAYRARVGRWLPRIHPGGKASL